MAKGTKTGGRKKGIANKVTQDSREAVAAFVNANAHRLQEWLDSVAKESPEKAFSLFQTVIEYSVPKLARHTHGSDKDDPLIIEHVIYKSVNARHPASE